MNKAKAVSNHSKRKGYSKAEEGNTFHSSKKRKHIIILITLFLVTFILYFPILQNDFHTWDDDVYVRTNERVQNGITYENVVWAFSTNYFGFYYPLTWLSHMLDCQIYGLNAKGHYLTNIILHCLNVCLLYLLIWLALGGEIKSLAVALLFALHPMNVETVAWIAERKNLLSTFFLLLALIFYVFDFKVEAVKGKRLYLKFACYIFFILGLMSKSSIVMFPVILLILDYYPLKRINFDSKQWVSFKKRFIQLVMEKIPLFVLSFISGVITIISQKEITALEPISEVTFFQRIGESLLGYGFYLKKLFLPFDLCALYTHHKGNYPLYIPILVFAMLIILTLAFAKLAKQKPILISGWLFFLISLLPVVGILQVGLQAYADRYVYFPYWGLFSILVYGLPWKKIISKNYFLKYLSIAMGILVCVFLFVVSRGQMETWRNDETLFNNIIKVSPDTFIAYFQLGFGEKKKGNIEKAKEFYELAVKCADKQMLLHPQSGRLYHDKANALMMLERYDEAVECFKKAIDLGFSQKEIYEKIEISNKLKLKEIVSKGKELSENKQFDEAERKFRDALEIAPDSPELWSYLGYIFEQKGNLDEAEKAFEKAIEMNPLYDTAIYNIAVVELKKNKFEEANERLKFLEKLNSPYAEQLKNLLGE